MTKRPRDVNALAKSIVDEAIGEAQPVPAEEAKDPAAVSLGRRGGLKARVPNRVQAPRWGS
jgi:hypothetical protein